MEIETPLLEVNNQSVSEKLGLLNDDMSIPMNYNYVSYPGTVNGG